MARNRAQDFRCRSPEAVVGMHADGRIPWIDFDQAGAVFKRDQGQACRGLNQGGRADGKAEVTGRRCLN